MTTKVAYIQNCQKKFIFQYYLLGYQLMTKVMDQTRKETIAARFVTLVIYGDENLSL